MSTSPQSRKRLSFDQKTLWFIGCVALLPVAYIAFHFIGGLFLTATAPSFPLHEAAREGKTAEVRRLIHSGVPVDQRDGNGKTPLYEALNSSKWETAESLISAGANPNLRIRAKWEPEPGLTMIEEFEKWAKTAYGAESRARAKQAVEWLRENGYGEAR